MNKKRIVQFRIDESIARRAKSKLAEAGVSLQQWGERQMADLVEGRYALDVSLSGEPLIEMANLDTFLTGLPKVIHVWSQGDDKKIGHGPRIKASFDSHRFDPSQNVSITISDDPQIVAPKSFKFGPQFTRSDFSAIRDFIIRKKDKLLKYWIDPGMTIGEILKD